MSPIALSQRKNPVSWRPPLNGYVQCNSLTIRTANLNRFSLDKNTLLILCFIPQQKLPESVVLVTFHTHNFLPRKHYPLTSSSAQNNWLLIMCNDSSSIPALYRYSTSLAAKYNSLPYAHTMAAHW